MGAAIVLLPTFQPGKLRLRGTHNMGQVGAQVCGLRAKTTPTSTPSIPPLPLLPTPWSSWLVPGLSLEGLAWGPGVGCCRGLE